MQRILLLRMDEAADSLAVSKSHIERMVARGEHAPFRLGVGAGCQRQKLSGGSPSG